MKFLWLGAAALFFVGGTASLRLARDGGGWQCVFAMAVCLIAANVLYSKVLTDDFLLGTVVSMMLCLIGYALVANFVFDEPLTFLRGTGIALAACAALLVSWPSASKNTLTSTPLVTENNDE